MNDDDDDSAPGWEAIDHALKPLYGEQEPVHWAATPHYVVGGSDPIDGISAYPRNGPLPHWHFVTYGFSELYAKESADLEISGYGFELTLRVRTTSFDEPPKWVYHFLQNLARYVFSSGNVFDAGHHMNLNSPIALGSDTKIRAIAFPADPELHEIETPHGRLQFLQVVGITLGELSAIKAWNTEHLLELLEPHLPLLITDLGRESLTDRDDITAAIRAGIDVDGSSTAFLFVGAASWRVDGKQLFLTLGANGVRDFIIVLPGRLPHDRELVVASQTHSITFVPSGACSWSAADDGNLAVHLTSGAAIELSRVLEPKRGTYRVQSFPALTIEVVPSQIKDNAGNVIEVIG